MQTGSGNDVISEYISKCLAKIFIYNTHTTLYMLLYCSVVVYLWQQSWPESVARSIREASTREWTDEINADDEIKLWGSNLS